MEEYKQNKELEAVQKILGEPIFPELTTSAWKIRTNLIVISSIAVGVVLAELRIKPDSSILGLKFNGLTDDALRMWLLIIIVYLTVHYFWVSIDYFFEWRLRITGTKVSFVTTGQFASEHGDYPKDPRQSTLYNWWASETKKIGNLTLRFLELEEKLLKLNDDLKTRYTSGTDAMNIVNACGPLHESREEMAQLRRIIEEIPKTVSAKRIPVSLERFDQWFRLFLRIQNLKWLVMDLILPFSISIFAIFLLLRF